MAFAVVRRKNDAHGHPRKPQRDLVRKRHLQISHLQTGEPRPKLGRPSGHLGKFRVSVFLQGLPATVAADHKRAVLFEIVIGRAVIEVFVRDEKILDALAVRLPQRLLDLIDAADIGIDEKRRAIGGADDAEIG